MSYPGDQRDHRIGLWLGDVSLEYGGISPYAFRILNALLVDREPGWRFLLLCESHFAERLALFIANYADFAEVQLIPSAVPGLSNHVVQWIDSLELDLLHFPTQTMLHPNLQVPHSVTMYGVEESSEPQLRVPYLITMHDVQELHFPEYFAPVTRAIRAVHYWKALKGARQVIVSFDHVKLDLIKFFGIAPEKISVCPISFKSISLARPTLAAAQTYSEKYAAWTPFLLYPSFTWPHKNHVQLMRALKRVKDDGCTNLSLICTGGTNHPHYAAIAAEAAELGLADSVLFAGIVAEDELRWLYEHTALVAIPTRYEAGSFPLYEAILLGAPVICSDVTSLPETIGDARFVFDPSSLEAFASLISRMLSDVDFGEANRTNSVKQAERLRDIHTAPYFYRAYRKALDPIRGYP